MDFLEKGSLPKNLAKTRKLKRNASYYVIERGNMYKRSFMAHSLKCLPRDQAKYVMNEIQRGICRMHLGSRFMTTRVLGVRYYWPTMREDCIEYMKKYEECLKFCNISHLLAKEVHTIVVPWPFTSWGVEILKPFPPTKGQLKFLLVSIDHFIKQIEVEPITTISIANVQKFIWKNIICRFEIPNT